jgi:hypothetical protein
VNHHATNCLNPFPSLNNYQTLMQADTDWAKAKIAHPVAAVGSTETGSEDEVMADISKTHPVTTIVATGHLATYMLANMSKHFWLTLVQ